MNLGLYKPITRYPYGFFFKKNILLLYFTNIICCIISAALTVTSLSLYSPQQCHKDHHYVLY